MFLAEWCRYTCLTVGDAICVYYNNRKYFIDVVEAKPPNPHPGGANAISVVDTDCEVRGTPGPQSSSRPGTPHTLCCVC